MPEDRIRFSFTRSAGPGGQNVNKLSTCAELRVALIDLPRSVSGLARDRLAGLAGRRLVAGSDRGPELLLVSDVHRSQQRNRAECLERLRELLVSAMAVPKKRRKTRPTRGSRERRLGAKRVRGDAKRRRSSPGDSDE